MRAFFTTVVLGFRHYFRDRSTLFWGVAFPLILMGLIGLAFGRSDSLTFSLSFIDHDGGALAEGLRRGLGEVPVFRVVDETDEAKGLEELRRGRRTLVVVVPPMASTEPVKVYFDQARFQDSQTALVILERFVAEANMRLSGTRQVVRIQARGLQGRPQLRFFDFLLPGILAMTVMQTGLMGVTEVVARYRQSLVLKRVLATPIHPMIFLSGLVGRYALTNVVQIAIIIVVAIYVFNARIAGSLLTVGGLIIFGALVFVGMGFAISTVSKTPESANLLGSAIHFPMMFLSGTLWPREFMPDFMQPVIAMLPLTPLVDAMRAVAARGDALTPYLAGLAYLGAWGVAAFALAARRFRWE